MEFACEGIRQIRCQTGWRWQELYVCFCRYPESPVHPGYLDSDRPFNDDSAKSLFWSAGVLACNNIKYRLDTHVAIYCVAI